LRILVDTQIFLWWDWGAPALEPILRAALTDADNEVFVSAASVWEIAIKQRLGKLAFAHEIVAAIGRNGFSTLPILPHHAERAGGLPLHHRDPFDRMLVAQAMLEQMVLGTQDRRLRLYDIPLLGGE